MKTNLRQAILRKKLLHHQHHRQLLVSNNFVRNGKMNIVFLISVHLFIFRLKREAQERTKTAAYLSRVFTGSDPTPDTPEPVRVETDDRKRRYNSQFNPDVAKQNSQQYATNEMNWRGH